MGSIIGGLVFVIVALAIVYLCVKYFKAHYIFKNNWNICCRYNLCNRIRWLY